MMESVRFFEDGEKGEVESNDGVAGVPSSIELGSTRIYDAYLELVIVNASLI